MRHDRVVMFMEAKAKLDALETLWRSNRSPPDGSVDGGAPLLPPRNSTVLLTKMTMHPNGGRENLPQVQSYVESCKNVQSAPFVSLGQGSMSTTSLAKFVHTKTFVLILTL